MHFDGDDGVGIDNCEFDVLLDASKSGDLGDHHDGHLDTGPNKNIIPVFISYKTNPMSHWWIIISILVSVTKCCSTSTESTTSISGSSVIARLCN